VGRAEYYWAKQRGMASIIYLPLRRAAPSHSLNHSLARSLTRYYVWLCYALLASDQLHPQASMLPTPLVLIVLCRVASVGHLVAPVSASQIRELVEGAQCDSLASNFAMLYNGASFTPYQTRGTLGLVRVCVGVCACHGGMVLVRFASCQFLVE
jgi:hypothetical protein